MKKNMQKSRTITEIENNNIEQNVGIDPVILNHQQGLQQTLFGNSAPNTTMTIPNNTLRAVESREMPTTEITTTLVQPIEQPNNIQIEVSPQVQENLATGNAQLQILLEVFNSEMPLERIARDIINEIENINKDKIPLQDRETVKSIRNEKKVY